jgi:hypothetical protein
MLASRVPGVVYAWNADSTASPPTPAGIIIPNNPMNYGGKLAFRALLFQRYRFNSVSIRAMNTCGVSQNGSAGSAYYKDWALCIKEYSVGGFLAFDRLMDLVPSLAAPNSVPQSVMNIPYPGNELYYVGTNAGGPWSSPPGWGDAQNRQEIQGAIVTVLDSVNALAVSVPLANLFLDYDIEFYDPLDVEDTIPSGIDEMCAVQCALKYVRNRPEILPEPLQRPELVRLTKLQSLLEHAEESKACCSAASASVLSSRSSSKKQ